MAATLQSGCVCVTCAYCGVGSGQVEGLGAKCIPSNGSGHSLACRQLLERCTDEPGDKGREGSGSSLGKVFEEKY